PNDGVIAQVAFFANDVLLGTVTNAPYTLPWPQPVQNFYSLIAEATGTDGVVRESPPVNFVLTPRNDDFTHRSTIPGAHARVTGSNYPANKEPDEPAGGGSSVWWTWTAPTNGVVRLTAGAGFYFAGLELFTGDALTNLSRVAQAAFRLSPVELNTTAGTAYQIAVEEFFGDLWGDYELTLDFDAAPANDQFANRIVLNGAPVTVAASNAGASVEPEEPLHDSISGGKSIWWSWLAPGTGEATITLTGHYPILAV